MKRSFSQLSEIIVSLQGESIVHYRIFLHRKEDEWFLYSMFLDVYNQLTSSKNFFYNYGEFAFLGGNSSGIEVAEWLSNNVGKTGEINFQIPKLQENINSHRFESGVQRNFNNLEEPHLICEISISGRTEINNRRQFLVASKCPSFTSLAEATWWFLFDTETGRQNDYLPDNIRIRWKQDGAWIKDVNFQAGEIIVLIEGKNVQGTRLEIRGGENLSIDKKLRKSGKKKFSIPKKLPQQILVILSRDKDWLDYRQIDLRFDKTFIEDSEIKDITAEISGIIFQGENETVELKEEVNSEAEKYLKTVVAFANGKGGVILFGVTDDGEVKGLTEKLDPLRNRISNAIRNRIEPKPKFHFKDCSIKNETVLALYIEAGDLHPYGIINNQKLQVHVRRGGTTFIASQHEIRELARIGMITDTTNNLWEL